MATDRTASNRDGAALPLVAIVGRPNVGKSTLFNRLVGRRSSITDPTPGVTRDALEQAIELGGVSVRLVDTGGITLAEQRSRRAGTTGRAAPDAPPNEPPAAVAVDEADLARAVAERALHIIAQATVILLVMDATEVTGEDQQLVDDLRPYTDRVILVVNKVDTAKRESLVWEFYAMGFANVVGVSAAHGRNADELIATIRGALEDLPQVAVATEPAAVRLAIVGKPNTGKSTLLNRLLGQQRSLVSDEPGTTRDPVVGRFTYRNVVLEVVDTAGIRRRARVASSVEYYSVNRAVSAIDAADVCVLMVDAVEGLSDQDKKIAALAIRRGVAVIVALSKWDQVEERPNMLRAMVDRIRFQFPILGFAPVLPVSGHTGAGVNPLLSAVVRLHRQLTLTISTGKLNTAAQQWVRRYAPTVRGREVRVRYATQVSANPVRFLFFVNRVQGASTAYRRFLENQIRAELGFADVPITVELRTSGRNVGSVSARERPRSESGRKRRPRAAAGSDDEEPAFSGEEQD